MAYNLGSCDQGATWGLIWLCLMTNSQRRVDYFDESRSGIYLDACSSCQDMVQVWMSNKPYANVGEVKSQKGFDGNFCSISRNWVRWSMTVRGNITYSKNEVHRTAMKRINVYAYLYAKRVSG